MRNANLAEEQRDVAELARGIGMDAVWPSARQADESGFIPTHLWQQLFDSGLTVPVPEELGGVGIGDAATWLVAVENLAYGDAAIASAAIVTGHAALLLARHGGSDHVAAVRRLTGDASARAAVALYEPRGRGGAEVTTSIDTDPGSIRVSGRKVGVPFASTAEYFVVIGVDSHTGGLRAAVVDANAEGVVIEPYGPTLGLKAAAWGTVSFDVTLPSDRAVGTAADADDILLSIGIIRLSAAATAIGLAERALSYAARYADERIAFGQPISTFQGVSFPLAEARMRIDASRLEIGELAVALDTGDSGGAADQSSSISRAVAYASDVANRATRTAVQTLGGHGFITDHPAELWYRAAATLSTLDSDPLITTFEPAL
ncbi:hypothetical protein AVZ31_13270 [Mycolicibacterium neoaurum]|uniref:acyl-CoA dehydrogenase family protein n=1 Tax=Mycolicibacterium neoaurum TaxID=1795 RepID=UPI000743F05B|nr:acyl-CoA dehydrogenase family protein [Mycolicibacterium neoaurum]KUM07893.1 hypothetical protein AVZ31_13270 [Mycolicibacterium neoaurum]